MFGIIYFDDRDKLGLTRRLNAVEYSWEWNEADKNEENIETTYTTIVVWLASS
jgi:hypothetical protein